MAQPPRLSPDLLSVPKGEAGAQTPTVVEDAPQGRAVLTLRIPPTMHDKLRLIAFTRRTTMQALVQDAIESWLASNEAR